MVKVQQKIAGTFRESGWRPSLLSHSQLSLYDAQTRSLHALGDGGGLCWLAISYRMGGLKRDEPREKNLHPLAQ